MQSSTKSAATIWTLRGSIAYLTAPLVCFLALLALAWAWPLCMSAVVAVYARPRAGIIVALLCLIPGVVGTAWWARWMLS